MELGPLILSRIQFAFVVSFHIIFPSFTIGLAAWLAVLEGMALATRLPVYRRLFDFWLKVFALAFAMGVVSGIVMAFQIGTNWSVLSERTGSIQGPLLGYEAFTAFLLEASFFGVMMFGRDRAPRWFYFFSCLMVALGTMASSYWIMCNNSWMQVPLGHRDRGRQDRSRRLEGHIARAGSAHPLAAYAARRLSHHQPVRRRDRRMASAAARGLGRIPCHARLGPRPRRRADPGADRSRPPRRRNRPQISAGKIRRHRGALA